MVFSPQFVRGIVSQIFPGLRKTQKVNLGLAVYGQIISQSTILSQIVREFPGNVKTKHKSKFNRLYRFVSNFRVKPEHLVETWTPWVITRFTTGKYICIALDWTGLSGNLMCLTASLVLYGRAIPLIWQITTCSDIKDSQNRIEERLIARLINLMPKGKKMVVTADRGFGRATFIKFLKGKGVLFAVRIKSKVWIKTSQGKSILLSKLSLKSDKSYWFEKVSLRADGFVDGVNLAGIAAKESDDPWFLITNLKKAKRAIEVYACRFEIEEGFKDMKHALGMEKLQTKNLMRVRRLLFITALSQALVMLIGKLSFRFQKLKETLITGKNACSRIWLAIQIVKKKLLGQPFWNRVRQEALSP